MKNMGVLRYIGKLFCQEEQRSVGKTLSFKVKDPDVGSLSPANRCARVLFPLPDCPIMPTI